MNNCGSDCVSVEGVQDVWKLKSLVSKSAYPLIGSELPEIPLVPLISGQLPPPEVCAKITSPPGGTTIDACVKALFAGLNQMLKNCGLPEQVGPPVVVTGAGRRTVKFVIVREVVPVFCIRIAPPS